MNGNRWCVVAAAVVLVLGWGPGVLAQDRLSDAGKGLSLDHPEGEQLLLIEDETGQSATLIDISGVEAVELAERALALGRTAESVLAETRSRDLFYDEGWRIRMIEACSDLENMVRSLNLLRPPDRFSELFAEVEAGARRYQLAAGMMRSAIARDEPLYGGAFDQFTAAGNTLLAGLVELRIENEREASEQPAPLLDPFASRQAAATLCKERYAGGPRAGYDSCMAQQAAAVDAIGGRFSFSVGVDEATFNSIRNGCRADWPDDMVARNRCELTRADAAKR